MNNSKDSDRHASDTIQLYPLFCMPLLAHLLPGTLQTSDRAKRALTWFLFTCVLLYFCHGLFFTVGLTHSMECLWTLCSLSVYPLYYVYICHLVSRPNAPLKLVLILFPGVAVAAAKYLFPEVPLDIARQVLFVVQLFAGV